MIRVGLIGDYKPEVKAHVAIPKAIELAANAISVPFEIEWLATPSLERAAERKLREYHALWAVPATPYESMEGALNAIRFARERRIPFLGTCGGYQHMLIEYARNVLDLKLADHAESNPDAELKLVTPLSCSVSEQTHAFRLVPGSKMAEVYGTNEIKEQYGICNYGLNPEFRHLFERGDMRVTGVDGNGEARLAELVSHPFYAGALYQPERSAFKAIVHPLIKAFLRAAAQVS
ncbi:hypothetical protein GE107_12590 [Cohnella sp. CFH 77786]|uniref:CTP synthase C-terminal region-related (seleno)protein n=1 Tax=Cohnella sp. CFH 77786 TaxID=2662265 RepID=UPI001C60EB70|nr:hypothetical protein [Cohnella sp. CFH 77786]MBW5446898.1 hypothetical protein [Cohnella sp. CFH 77786]